MLLFLNSLLVKYVTTIRNFVFDRNECIRGSLVFQYIFYFE